MSAMSRTVVMHIIELLRKLEAELLDGVRVPVSRARAHELRTVAW